MSSSTVAGGLGPFNPCLLSQPLPCYHSSFSFVSLSRSGGTRRQPTGSGCGGGEGHERGAQGHGHLAVDKGRLILQSKHNPNASRRSSKKVGACRLHAAVYSTVLLLVVLKWGRGACQWTREGSFFPLPRAVNVPPLCSSKVTVGSQKDAVQYYLVTSKSPKMCNSLWRTKASVSDRTVMRRSPCCASRINCTNTQTEQAYVTVQYPCSKQSTEGSLL